MQTAQHLLVQPPRLLRPRPQVRCRAAPQAHAAALPAFQELLAAAAAAGGASLAGCVTDDGALDVGGCRRLLKAANAAAPAAIEAGEYDRVKRHCEIDLYKTRALAERLGLMRPVPNPAEVL